MDFTHNKCADTVNLSNRLLRASSGGTVIISPGSRNVWPEPHDQYDDDDGETSLNSGHMTALPGEFSPWAQES